RALISGPIGRLLAFVSMVQGGFSVRNTPMVETRADANKRELSRRGMHLAHSGGERESGRYPGGARRAERGAKRSERRLRRVRKRFTYEYAPGPQHCGLMRS